MDQQPSAPATTPAKAQPVLVLRFEAQTAEKLAEYRTLMEGVVEEVKQRLGSPSS